MTVVKKDLTTSNVVSPGDGVYAEQLNYGASTGGLRSVSDVITRHFEDYNAKFIPNRIYGNSALTQSGLQFTLGGGASVYATVNGRWIKISADESHTVSTTNGTYVVYLTVANASSDEENRNPSNDTVSLTSVLIGSYTDANDKLPLAVVVVSGGAYSSHTDLYGVAGSSQIRASAIRPANGSSINFFGGTYPQDSLVGLFNATRLRLQDDIYLALGTDNDGLLRYSTANSQLEFTLPSAGLEISGGTITGVPNPAANDEVANKAYVDAQITLEDVDIAADTGTIAIDLDSETLTFTGGTGIDTSATGNAVTIATNQDIATTASPSFAGLALTGALTTSSTIDGRDIATDGTKLDGIESNATADQNAADIRTLGFFDTTNDGTGSGLDADLLDGQHGSYYAISSHTHNYAATSHTHSNDYVAVVSHDLTSTASFGANNSGNKEITLIAASAARRYKINESYTVTIRNDDTATDFELQYSINGGTSWSSADAFTDLANGSSTTFTWSATGQYTSAVNTSIKVKIITTSTNWDQTSSTSLSYKSAYDVEDW